MEEAVAQRRDIFQRRQIDCRQSPAAIEESVAERCDVFERRQIDRCQPRARDEEVVALFLFLFLLKADGGAIQDFDC